MSSIAVMLGVPLWDGWPYCDDTCDDIYKYITHFSTEWWYQHLSTVLLGYYGDKTTIYLSILSYPIPSHPILSYLSIHLSIWTCIYCTTNNMWWECLNMGYRIWDNSFDSEKYDKRTWILGYPMFRQPHFTTHFIPVPWDSAAMGVSHQSIPSVETSGLALALFKN